jgi:hypothetical protein
MACFLGAKTLDQCIFIQFVLETAPAFEYLRPSARNFWSHFQLFFFLVVVSAFERRTTLQFLALNRTIISIAAEFFGFQCRGALRTDRNWWLRCPRDCEIAARGNLCWYEA